MTYKLPVDHTIRIHMFENGHARMFYGDRNENTGLLKSMLPRVKHLLELGWKITEVLVDGEPLYAEYHVLDSSADQLESLFKDLAAKSEAV